MAKLFKRDGSRVWYAWVPKQDGGVKRVSTLCTDKRAAEAVLARLEREAVDPAFANANAATTQKILDDYYLSRKTMGRAEASIAFVFKKSKHLVRLLPKRAADITHASVMEYVKARLKEWAVAPVIVDDETNTVIKPGRLVRRTTVKKELNVLRPALALARKNKLFTEDPDAVIPELDDDHKDGSRSLSRAEIALLKGVLPPDKMAIVAYAAATGCDFSALWRARAKDVSSDGAVVQIHGSKRKSRERPAQLPLAEQRALVLWAVKHAAGTDEGLLFKPWVNMRRDLYLAAKKVGIAGFSANDLRRTYGTWLHEANIEPHLIAPAMGHADSRMVERVYGKLRPEKLGALMVAAARPHGMLMGGTSDDFAAFGADGANAVGAVSQPEKSASDDSSRCAGAESNRRHGDFQSQSPEPTITREFGSEIGADGAGVTGGGTYVGCDFVAALLVARRGLAALYGGTVAQ